MRKILVKYLGSHTYIKITPDSIFRTICMLSFLTLEYFTMLNPIHIFISAIIMLSIYSLLLVVYSKYSIKIFNFLTTPIKVYHPIPKYIKLSLILYPLIFVFSMSLKIEYQLMVLGLHSVLCLWTHLYFENINPLKESEALTVFDELSIYTKEMIYNINNNNNYLNSQKSTKYSEFYDRYEIEMDKIMKPL